MSFEIDADYNQQFIFPPSLEDLLSKDDPARFIREFVEILDIASMGMKVRQSNDGRPNYSSKLLLKIWLYGWFDKVKSSRGLQKACTKDISMMWLAGMHQPDHNTLWRFYKDNKKAIKEIFKYSIKTALENNLIGMALHAIDGTKIMADVSRDKVLKKEKLEEKLKELDSSIEKYFAEAEEITEDTSVNLEKLPEELCDRINLRDSIKHSLSILSEKDTKFLNETDEDARMMKTREGKRFAYNSQAVVDSHKGIIVGADVLQDENDVKAMNKMLKNAKENLRVTPETNVLDSGYFSGEEINEAEDNCQNVLVNIPQNTGSNASINIESEYHQNKFKYDKESDTYRCPFGGILKYQRQKSKKDKNYKVKVYHCKEHKTCLYGNECSKDSRGRTIEISPYKEIIENHKVKISVPANKKLLQRRMTIVEPVFGIVKNVLGFRRYSARGLENACSQWDLVCTVMNLRKIFKEWSDGKVVLT